jgi:hypothetical protein
VNFVSSSKKISVRKYTPELLNTMEICGRRNYLIFVEHSEGNAQEGVL